MLSGSSVRENSRGFLGQHHGSVLPSASRGDILTNPQRSLPTDSLLGGAEDLHLSSVCSRLEQCGSGCSVLPQSGDRGRLDTALGGLRLALQEVAGDDRSFCFRSESPLWCLFCVSVGSHGCG